MAATTSSYELYRGSSIGIALTDTLDELISTNMIEPQLAMKIVGNFDRVFQEVISDRVRTKASFKGSLDTYRFCDDVWTFLIRNVQFKLDDSKTTLTSNAVKIVSMTNKKAQESPKDTKVVEREKKPRIAGTQLKITKPEPAPAKQPERQFQQPDENGKPPVYWIGMCEGVDRPYCWAEGLVDHSKQKRLQLW